MIKFEHIKISDFTEVLKNSTSLVIGILVGYMVTLTFQAGLDKYNKVIETFQKEILMNHWDLVAAIAGAAGNYNSREMTHGIGPAPKNLKMVIKTLQEMKEMIQVLPFVFEHSMIKALEPTMSSGTGAACLISG